MKTYEELEELADAISSVDEEGEDRERRLMELVGDLTRKDLTALIEIHRRRAWQAALG